MLVVYLNYRDVWEVGCTLPQERFEFTTSETASISGGHIHVLILSHKATPNQLLVSHLPSTLN